MPQIANIVVNDGATTPVAHTFKPTSRQAAEAILHEAVADGSLQARPELQLVSQPLGQGGRTTEVKKITLLIPDSVTETINGVPVTRVLGYDKLEIKHISYAGSNKQKRKNLRVLGANVMQNAIVQQWIDDAEAITG